MMAIRHLLSSLHNLTPSELFASGRGYGPEPIVGGDLPVPDDGPYADAGVEPPLEEVLDDPVVRLLMRADRLEPDQIRSALISRPPRIRS